MRKLSLAFLEFAKGRADLPANDEELEHLLERVVETGHDGRPYTVKAELFVSYLAQRLPAARKDVPLAQVLFEPQLPDLYLVCACVHKMPEAIDELEKVHLSELRTWLKRTSAVVDEVCQDLRIQLLVGLTPAGPRLARYSGRGSLQHWIHVVASRLLPPRVHPSPAGDLSKDLENLLFPGSDPETALNKRHVVHAFRQALRDALAVLSEEQLYLLKLRHVDGLTTKALGQMFGVSQPTASRRLDEAHAAVYEETLRLLQERLQVSSTDLNSLLIAIGTSFDVSIRWLLGESDEGKKK